MAATVAQPGSAVLILHSPSDRTYSITTPDGVPRYSIRSTPTWISHDSNPGHKDWRAIFYREISDNDKQVVGQCMRSSEWKSMKVQMGGSVEKVVMEERDVMMREKHKKSFGNKIRRLFGHPETEFVGDSEKIDTSSHTEGPGKDVEMVRLGVRRYAFTLEGVEYTITGTRMFNGKWRSWMKMKGVSGSIKMVMNDSHTLVAAADSSIWSCKKTKIHLFSSGSTTGNGYDKEELAPSSKALDEQTILWTLWYMLEAEARKRNCILETLEAIAESIGGVSG